MPFRGLVARIEEMKHIFSMKMAVLMLFLFGALVGGATFIENDYGTQTVQALIYKTKWFEAFLAYFIAILVYQIIKHKSYKTKPSVFLFHISFLVIAMGALVTRYIGYEGIMHIREGDTSSTMVSAEKVIQIQAAHGKESASLEEPVFFSSMTKNNLHYTLSVNDKEVKVELLDYFPTAHQELITVKEGGKKLLSLKISTGQRGEDYFIEDGERKDFGSFYVGYNVEQTTDKPTFLIKDDGDALKIDFPYIIETLNMDDKSTGELRGGEHTLQNRMLYRFGKNAVVFRSKQENAKLVWSSNDYKTQGGKPEFMRWKVSVGDKSETIITQPYQGQQGKVKNVNIDGLDIKLSVGAKIIDLPFSLKLDDFILDRYPGSMTPSSYASDVVLIDKEQNINMPYKIYMNHVLDHRNYRFFQSSYDKDEKGTVLSVNHDPGTLPTYIGYLLLTIGMMWNLFDPKGRFMKLLKNTRKLQSSVAAVMMIMAVAFMPHAPHAASPEIDETTYKQIHKYDKEHARNFGTLAVQDHQGRMKPMDTVAHEVIAKITGRTALYEIEPMQMFLGMMMEPQFYQSIPMIKIGHKKIAVTLGLPEDTKFAKFADFFNESDSSYKIFSAVTEASQKRPLEQSKYDKELIKIDERVNVAFMTYQGSLLRIYPKPEDANNKWMAPMNAIKAYSLKHSEEVRLSISAYFHMVAEGVRTGNWSNADIALRGIRKFQNEHGSAVIPSQTHIEMEIKYNKFGLFGKLVPLYLLLGVILLIFAFINVLKPAFPMKWVMRIALGVLVFGFILHLIGLGARWYIAGHAPWSNAYESIVFIAASTVFAGLLLARHTPFALAGTAILAGITMGVAHMSFINPEITTLVPVLKSYWLMIHVATIISGDGFLGLGSILSLLVLILYIMKGQGKENIDRSIKELTSLSEMSIIIGLFIYTIGNFLGGVWANESWGRYWGWDPKETWAAVTILIYAMVLHLRFVPALKSNFIYNAASVWAYSTVIMTYFGVNYYLSGLHSYAAGDPVPIPMWVYYAVAGLFVLTLLAARNRKLN
jgi:cytochrome c-type biogenesis protein CcsB